MNKKTARERYAAAASALTIQFDEELKRITPSEANSKDGEPEGAREEGMEEDMEEGKKQED
ncbi:MAG TPA: hypothetical protein EYN40_06490 [Planctomycetes bacterium]|jgi:hypothetical protein|nr:hypothetical protein [Planctomycetota bacterium]